MNKNLIDEAHEGISFVFPSMFSELALSLSKYIRVIREQFAIY